MTPEAGSLKHLISGDPKKRMIFFSRSASRGLGIAHLVFASLLVLTQISYDVIRFKNQEHVLSYTNLLAVSPGIWCGFGIIIAGVVSLIAGRKQSRPWVVAHNFFSIFAFVLAVLAIVLYGYSIVVQVMAYDNRAGPEYICEEWKRVKTPSGTTERPRWENIEITTMEEEYRGLRWDKTKELELKRWQQVTTTDKSTWKWWMKYPKIPELQEITTKEPKSTTRGSWWNWLGDTRTKTELRWWLRKTKTPTTNTQSTNLWQMFTNKPGGNRNDDNIWIDLDLSDHSRSTRPTTTESSRNDNDKIYGLEDDEGDDGDYSSSSDVQLAVFGSKTSTIKPATEAINSDDEGDDGDYSSSSDVQSTVFGSKTPTINPATEATDTESNYESHESSGDGYDNGNSDDKYEVDSLRLATGAHRQLKLRRSADYYNSKYTCVRGRYDIESWDKYYTWCLAIVVHLSVLSGLALIEVLLTMISASQSCVSLCCGPTENEIYEFMKSSKSNADVSNINQVGDDCDLLADVLPTNSTADDAHQFTTLINA